MRICKKGVSILLCMLVLLTAFSIQVFAAGKIDTEQDVTFTISYKDGETPIANAHFDVYYFADIDEYARLTLDENFLPYKDSVNGMADLANLEQDQWASMASTLKGYVQRDKLPVTVSGITDEAGKLEFTLPVGVYFIIGSRATIDDFNTYSAVPFMVFLPDMDYDNNAWCYTVEAAPKFIKEMFPPEDDGNIVTRKVLKIWDDEGYESIRPREIKVDLLCDGEIFDTQVLTEENSWRYAWDNLDYNHDWNVVENELPDYAVTVSQRGITFMLENKFVAPIIGVDPPVQKKIVGDTPSTDSEFVFTLTAADESCPMPEGSDGLVKTMTIVGAGSKEFGYYEFTKPGTYVYKIAEKNTGVDGYKYDTEVYTITYEVTQKNGELLVERVITDSDGAEAAVVEFTNTYKRDKNLPQTGLLWWPVPILLCIGIIFIIFGVLRRRRYE